MKGEDVEPGPDVECTARCAVCDTPVSFHGDAGWRHDLGFREHGCEWPWPAP